MLRRGEVTEDAEQVLTLRQDRAQAAELHRRIIVAEKRVLQHQQEAPAPENERQPQRVTPEHTEAVAEPGRPAAASASPESAAHKPEPQRERPAPLPEPQPEPKTPLPDDLAGLEAMWKREAQRYFAPIEKRGRHIWEVARAQQRGCQDALRAHDQTEPQKPKWFAWLRQGGYERRLEGWQQQRDELVKRQRQLEKRMDVANRYWLKDSQGELMARQRLQTDQPELWRKLEQAREQERQRRQEKLNQEIEQRRQRERERGPSRGMEL